MNTKIKITETTKGHAGSCFDCELRPGDNYKVYSILITPPGGNSTELRYCEKHIPAFFSALLSAGDALASPKKGGQLDELFHLEDMLHHVYAGRADLPMFDEMIAWLQRRRSALEPAPVAQTEPANKLIGQLQERNRLLRREANAAIKMDAACQEWQQTGNGQKYRKYQRRRDAWFHAQAARIDAENEIPF